MLSIVGNQLVRTIWISYLHHLRLATVVPMHKIEYINNNLINTTISKLSCLPVKNLAIISESSSDWFGGDHSTTSAKLLNYQFR